MISFIARSRWRRVVAMLVDPFSHEAKRAAGQRTGDHLATRDLDLAESPP
jgi:hypothetical protein